MRILYTSGSGIVSKLIRSVLREPVSHVAIEYKGFVVHATFWGLRVESYAKFLEKRKIEFQTRIENRPKSLFAKLAEFEGASYDVGAFLWLGLYFFLRRLGLPLPKKNLWQDSGMFLCTEWVTKFINEKQDSMITPYGLYKKLEKTNG